MLELPFYSRKPFGEVLVWQGEQLHIFCESRYFFFNQYDFLSGFQSLTAQLIYAPCLSGL